MEHAIAVLIVVALCTVLTRALPFIILSGKKKLPDTVKYLGNVLPAAIMVILVVYCLRGISFIDGNHGLPEMLAVIIVALLHIWKRNTLLSIAVGTAAYMFFVQIVFL